LLQPEDNDTESEEQMSTIVGWVDRSPRPVSARPDRPRLALVQNRVAPIVAAVDGSTAGGHVVDAAVRLAAKLNAPLTFVYVRRGPPGFLGTPVFERRLTRKMAEARRVIDDALRGAAQAGVAAEGEILEGSPRKRIVEFAGDRSARLIVVGSRRRRLGRSVSCAVVRAARRPVLVARGSAGAA
jgi:nucleotide-binding universal stress UspA family protein